jgi:hypothetical protein
MRNLALASLLGLVACSKEPPAVTANRGAEPPPAPATAHGEKKDLPWIHDDFPAALARAKAENKGIFIDAWAPWCHVCISMKSFIFPELTTQFAARFVWLLVNTEDAKNVDVLGKLTIEGLPTFFVMSPEETVLARWVGSGTVEQMSAFLTDAEHTVAARTSKSSQTTMAMRISAADTLALAGKHDEAAARYGEVLTEMKPDDPRRGAMIYGRLDALSKSSKPDLCVDEALARLPESGNTSSAIDGLWVALDCADKLPKEDPRTAKLVAAALPRASALADDAKAPLTADDRGDAYRIVLDLHERSGDKEAARKVAERQLEMLNKSAAAAPDPIAASTHDGARLETYIYLGRADEAVAFLAAGEKVMPDDYNKPHRLARALLALERYGEALAAIDRALAKVPPGPRKGIILGLKADILEKQGQLDGARQAVKEQVAFYESLPEGMKKPTRLAGAQARLEKLLAAK